MLRPFEKLIKDSDTSPLLLAQLVRAKAKKSPNTLKNARKVFSFINNNTDITDNGEYNRSLLAYDVLANALTINIKKATNNGKKRALESFRNNVTEKALTLQNNHFNIFTTC